MGNLLPPQKKREGGKKGSRRSLLIVRQKLQNEPRESAYRFRFSMMVTTP